MNLKVTPRDRVIRISPGQIFEHTKYHPMAKPKDRPWRELVDLHFRAEHGVQVINFDKLLYLMPEDPIAHPFVEVVGRIGISLSEPKE